MVRPGIIYFKLVVLISILYWRYISSSPKIQGNTYKLPLCGIGEDSHGRWFRVTHINNNSVVLSNENSRNATADWRFEAHFLEPNGPGEALSFDDLWLPSRCSYMRFTNRTIEQCVLHEISKGAHSFLSGVDAPRVHLVFLGDSALRGYVCGLGRILSGSEMFGPNINSVCGDVSRNAVSTNMLGQPVTNEYFGGKLLITFMYVKGFHIKHLDWHLEFFTYNTRPYAIILNTGAWDFDEIARSRNYSLTTEECSTDEEKKISRERADDFVNKTMWELGLAGNKTGTKMIYRNNHHNARFGTACADRAFEDMIHGSPWYILDSRRISKDIWKSQTYDGFHFDRHRISTVEMHEYYIAVYRSRNHTLLGALEMQFTQSLLHMLFYDCIREILY